VLQTQLAREDMEQFRLEARTIARLEHPHIVRVLDFGVEERTPFLVMSYAPNGTLRTRHPKGTRVPLSTVVSYVQQIAPALQYAHEQRLIHRDIKPENLLVGKADEVLLSDFGIALVAQSSHYQSTHDMAGTIPYMAPEQIEAHPRPASDQYSLGIVVYEWLSGDRPFHGSFTEVAVKHSVVPPPSLCEKVPTVSPAVEQVVMTALAKDPRGRFGSVQAFARALEQASQPNQLTPYSVAEPFLPPTPQPSLSTPPPVTSAPPASWRRRGLSRGIAVLLLMATVLVIGAGILISSLTGSPSGQQDVYLRATHGSPTLDDPLSRPDGNSWDETSSSGEGCAFVAGAYHASELQQNNATPCMAQVTNFSSFVYQVRMTILRGDTGGIIFRATGSTAKYYSLSISQDGSYELVKSVSASGTNDQVLLSGSTRAFKTGLNQANLVAVVAQSNLLSLYVNKQYVAGVSDSSYTSGEIGVLAQDATQPTEVAYSNAQVWQL
jgi:eukaryotic-like serine/threonine-protein kinase